jgi:hypothetical protein
MVRMIVVVPCSLIIMSIGATAQDMRVSDDWSLCGGWDQGDAKWHIPRS